MSDDSDIGELIIDEKLNLTSFPARFSGNIDREATEAFIAKIESFKESQKICNESALSDLSCVFEGQAATWWSTVKDAVNTWEDALTLIRYVYAPVRAPHLIYSDIFSQRQGDCRVEDFIRRKRKLFAQLAKPHPENVQIDMIYWMFSPSIRRNIPRDSIETFDDIIDQANSIQMPVVQKEQQTEKHEKANGKKKRKRCGFCRMNGHITDECRKRAKKMSETEASDCN